MTSSRVSRFFTLTKVVFSKIKTLVEKGKPPQFFLYSGNFSQEAKVCHPSEYRFSGLGKPKDVKNLYF